jgi:hypothetical protein
VLGVCRAFPKHKQGSGSSPVLCAPPSLFYMKPLHFPLFFFVSLFFPASVILPHFFGLINLQTQKKKPNAREEKKKRESQRQH